MALKKKEYPVELRQTVIKYYLNGDSEHEIAQKLIIPRTSVHYIIDKYKKTECLQNIIDRDRKRKTTVYFDRAIHRIIKADRRKSASSVTAVIETEFGIIISEQMVRRRLHEAGFKGRVARKKSYVEKTNQMKRIQYAKNIESSLCASEIKCYGLMKVNLTCWSLTEGSWFDEHRRKHSILDARFPSLNTEEEMYSVGIVSHHQV